MDANIKQKPRITNSNQFAKLVEEMEKNPEIARGFPNFGKSTSDITEFWKNLAVMLNSLGPPVKESLEWRKVWNDFKRNVKQKIANNHGEVRGTGGGQNKQIPQNPMEQQVYAVLQLEKSGAPCGKSFGVLPCREHLSQPNQQIRVGDNFTESTLSQSGHQNEFINSDSSNVENDRINNTTVDVVIVDHSNVSKRANKIRNSRPVTQNNKENIEKKRIHLLEQQTGKQNEIVELLQKIEKNTYNLQYYNKKTYELKAKKYKLVEQQIERQQKNELFCQKLRLEKLKLKKRKLPLQERKLGIQNSSNSESDD